MAKTTISPRVPDRLRWLPVLIAVFVLAAFANGLTAPFHFDDTGSIVANPTIRELWPIWKPFMPPTGTGDTVAGRPLLNFSFALNYAVSGDRPWSYHALNILLHLASALILFGLVRRTLGLVPAWRETDRAGTRRALLAAGVALLWAVHPLQTESVTYIVQRAESLVGLWYLLTLYCFCRGLETGGRESGGPAPAATMRESPRWWFGWSLAACLLGMASKEVMATAPLAVLLFDRTFGAGGFAAAWRARARFYLALGATWLLLGWLVIQSGGRGGTVGADIVLGQQKMEWWAYALKQCEAITRYLQLSLWPHPLVFDYGTLVIRDVGDVALRGIVLLALLGATLWLLWRRPTLGFAAALFFLILGPTSSVIPVATQTMAEHRMYLPLAGVVVLVVLAFDRWTSGRSWLAWVPVAIALSVATVARNAQYHDALVLWQDTLRKQPGSARAHANVAAILAQRGRFDEAVVSYRRALELRPGYLMAISGLAPALLRTGRTAEAIVAFGNLLELQPSAEGNFTYGRMLDDAGRPAEAINHFREAIRMNPAAAEVHLRLATVLAREGRAPEALPHLEEARRLRPTDPAVLNNLAAVLVGLGRTSDAIAVYRTLVALEPSGRSTYALGFLLARSGDRLGALEALRESTRMEPGLLNARVLLGDLLVATDPAGAAAQYAAAVQLAPNDAELRRKLDAARRNVGP